jgi:hypothetical protein
MNRLPAALILGLLLSANVDLLAAAKQDKPIPHPHDPVLHAEHMALLDLVRDADVTHPAVRDGRWSDPVTWKDGQVPTADANVLIPKGKTVTVDRVFGVKLRTIRVDGQLHFAPDEDTALVVDTLVVSPEGHLVMGTPAAPIVPGKQARLTFADRGPIDTHWDPTLLSRGLISHGEVTLCGTPTTSYVALARPPRKGDRQLRLAQQPTNWKKADRLILTGTRLGAKEDEDLTILDISGSEVTVRPLSYSHPVPAPDLSVYVANVSRNVILESENRAEIRRRGHVMLMHSPRVAIAHVAFNDLGRTDKRTPINDPRLDDRQRLIAGSGSNPRGRYAVHFHRTGTDRHSPPAQVRGSAVVNSPGWGFVNHSGHVVFEDNVAFNVTGAAFVTEAGDEIGAFRRNLAIYSVGSGEDVDGRRKVQDFGHEGDGFWFQGGGVAVEQNIAAGQAQTGFVFFTLGLEQEGLGRTKFLAANLLDASWARGQQTVDVGEVPIRSFKGNIAFASHTGIIPRFHLGGPKGGGPRYPGSSVLQDSIVWNTTYGVHIRYTSQVTLRKLRLIGNQEQKLAGFAGVLGQLEGINHIRCEDLRVEGWRVGVDVRESGDWVIQGGHYDNHVNILIPTMLDRRRLVEITGDIHFANPGEALPGHYDLYLAAQFKPSMQGRDPNVLFMPDVVRYQGKQLYYREQAADYVPLRKQVAPAEEKQFGSADGCVPEELIGKTNRELWDQYRLAIGGTVAPADATTDPRIHALIGKPASYPPPLWASTRTHQLRGYKFVCGDADKRKAGELPPRDLREGWNLLTLDVRGDRRSFLIFASESPK